MGPVASVLGKIGKLASAIRPRRRKGQPLRAASKEFSEAEGEDLWLLVGLGNPGSRYDETRHNVGFMLLDTLARQLGIHMDKLQFSAAVGRGRLCEKRVLLAKPMTFMNNSGESVGKLARYYKIPLQRVMVVYDDMDLSSGAVRLRAKGGHGGHNGMRSITQHFSGSKEFPRLRIGIGRPAGKGEVISHVLQGFSKKEREDIDFAIQDGIDTIKAVLELGMEKALSGLRVSR
ncbi:g12334 [Coccomyxa viridis]|uniref:peptidyl-tRNA hydrolase n=1 Tax=Coccomyxa viridis TaxID=1274662 RepID=A0ABP1GH41_9CHLO